MSPLEVTRRVADEARRRSWRRRCVRSGDTVGLVDAHDYRQFPVRLPDGARSSIPPLARHRLLDAANRMLEGEWSILGVRRLDVADPDWFFDPATGRRAPQERYAFGIDHRSEDETGNVKQVWELSRHHHLTLLAAAWFVSHDERYATVVSRQLRSWWAENPFLSGVHWISGIELGIRLISWTWTRRLLDGWPAVSSLFEQNALAVAQLRWHQEYLSAFRSSGSSANNHIIAEAAGLLVSTCAFPWFPESDRWRKQATSRLERELERNTFPSGVNRELASDYHAFVAELVMVAAVEAAASGSPLSEQTWTRLCRMVDVAAAIVDERLRGPRQGDGDDGRVLLVDVPRPNRWPSTLASGSAIFGPLPWWPSTVDADVRSALLSALTRDPIRIPDRPEARPSHFRDAGMTLLRTANSVRPEVWCRCDSGPQGFLSIAAHAHADALSVEVRHGGVDILADPGTYCYHGEPEWRSYFRSTLGHNTLELDGEDQSVSTGPFMWRRHASSRLLGVAIDGPCEILSWSARHDGYCRLDPPAVHVRTVRLYRAEQRLEILDRIESAGRHPCRLAFHLGPAVRAHLEDSVAWLEWAGAATPASACLSLPRGLEWEAHRGETDPIMGWYSPGFGSKEPTTTLLGTGTCGQDDDDLLSVLEFIGCALD